LTGSAIQRRQNGGSYRIHLRTDASPYTKLLFHCPKILSYPFYMWWIFRSVFHKYATALTVYWIPFYAEVIYIRVGFLVLEYHLTCLCSLITHTIYFCSTLRLLNCTEQVTSNGISDLGCGVAYFSRYFRRFKGTWFLCLQGSVFVHINDGGSRLPCCWYLPIRQQGVIFHNTLTLTLVPRT